MSAKAVCSLIILYFAWREIQQLRVEGLKQYFMGDIWNKFDMLLCITYFAYAILSTMFMFAPEESTTPEVMKILDIAVIMLSFCKLTFYLRIYDSMSFLVQMIQSVFYDLRFFLLFFGIFLSFFGLLLLVIIPVPSDYDTLSVSPLAYFLIALRTSVGDNEMGDYNSETYGNLSWLVWLVIVIVGNIVFMNFIIAVVNSSYENCMTKSVAQAFKTKVDMIVEREQIMTDQEIDNPLYFPNYIVMRKQGGGLDGDAGQW